LPLFELRGYGDREVPEIPQRRTTNSVSSYLQEI
jgi:hypothetical protein